MSEKSFNNNFNAIRFMAALMIVYGHMCHLSGTPVFFLGQDAISTVGSKTFIVISGFLITKSYLADSNFLRYMTKRCFRIFPALFGLIFFTIFIIGPVFTSLTLSDYFNDQHTWYYLKNLLLYPVYGLPGVFSDNIYPVAINGSLWILPVEFAMYLLLPVFICFFSKKSIKWGMLITGFLFMGVEIIRNLYFRSVAWVVWGTNWPDALALLPFFFIGSSLSQVKNKKFFNLQAALVLLVFLLSISFPYAIYNFLLLFILPYVVITFATVESPIFGRFLSKSDITYGLFLYAFPVQQIVSNLLMSSHLSMNILFVISTCITLGLAFLSWCFIEKPTQKFSRSLLKRI